MAFIAGQEIFTNEAWKKVEDISGKDKVLVRNFLGDAEFIQPFALKKRHYDGEIIQLGARDWSFSVTPEHKILYDRRREFVKMEKTTAEKFELNVRHQIYRKFNYMFPEELRKEYITIWDEFGKRTVTIQHEDWYKLVGYVLCRGFIKTGYGRPMLYLFLDEYNIEKEILILGDIFDRMGLPYHVQYSEKTRAKLVVSSKNTLASRLNYRLGSFKRKEMYLSDRIIYRSTKEYAKILLDSIAEASRKFDTPVTDTFQMSTTNKRLLDSLVLFGTMHGYGVRYYASHNIGDKTPFGVVKKQSYVMKISQPTDLYTPKYKKTRDYSGNVYEIDLFNGQVYVKEGSMPVWIDPK